MMPVSPVSYQGPHLQLSTRVERFHAQSKTGWWFRLPKVSSTVWLGWYPSRCGVIHLGPLDSFGFCISCDQKLAQQRAFQWMASEWRDNLQELPIVDGWNGWNHGFLYVFVLFLNRYTEHCSQPLTRKRTNSDRPLGRVTHLTASPGAYSVSGEEEI